MNREIPQLVAGNQDFRKTKSWPQAVEPRFIVALGPLIVVPPPMPPCRRQKAKLWRHKAVDPRLWPHLGHIRGSTASAVRRLSVSIQSIETPGVFRRHVGHDISGRPHVSAGPAASLT